MGVLGGRHRDGTAVAFAFVAVLLIVELAARVAAIWVPAPDGWNVPGMAAQARTIDAVAGRGGSEVVVLGSSSAGTGIEPGRIGARSVKFESAFNAWVSGGTARGIELLAGDLVVPRLRPRVVVIGLTSRELNDNGGGDRAYEALRSSPDRRRLSGTETLAQRLLDRPLSRISAFIRLRHSLRDTSTLVEQLREPTDPPDIAADGRLLYEFDTFAIRPAHADQEREALSAYSVGGQELAALRSLVHHLRTRGIDVLIVNLPVEEESYLPLHPRGRSDDDRYRAALAALVAAEGIPFLDARLEPWPRDLFADENHLNLRGAERLSDLVATAIDALPAPS